jgi:dTMP kinase
MSVEEGIKRTQSRGKADRFETEKMDFYEAIRRAYLARAKAEPQRIKVIDAFPAVETVQSDIVAVLRESIESLGL